MTCERPWHRFCLSLSHFRDNDFDAIALLFEGTVKSEIASTIERFTADFS